jgi:thiol-disulfide isomerase/thioredoxin
MKKFLALAVLAVGVASAQVAPFGLDMKHGVKVLAFVTADCPACEALRELDDLPILFVGPEPSLPYMPYRQDTGGNLVARTFYIQQAPTVVVLEDGQEVTRYVGAVGKEVIIGDIAMIEQGVLSPQYDLEVRVGEQVDGRFADYTGMVVFWKQDCVWCEREEADVAALCEAGEVPVIVLAVTIKAWPDSCTGLHDSETYEAWGIPGAPVHVYLDEGRVMWIDLGYREDLVVPPQGTVVDLKGVHQGH